MFHQNGMKQVLKTREKLQVTDFGPINWGTSSNTLLSGCHIDQYECFLVFFFLFFLSIIIIIIIFIIIIIIIILGISFMQGIYTYIPETNHVPREHCVATILM